MANDDIFGDAEHRMSQAIEALRRELGSIRTGRAAPSLIEHISVEYYGTPTPLQQIAAIHAPDARTLTVQPWDRKALDDIEKALQKSDLGITPLNDGTVIRITFPQPTAERRKELVKQAHKRVDDAKVAVRNVRRDAHDHLREQEKNKLISEDEQKRGADRLQKLTDKYIAEIDQIAQAKEQEILAV